MKNNMGILIGVILGTGLAVWMVFGVVRPTFMRQGSEARLTEIRQFIATCNEAEGVLTVHDDAERIQFDCMVSRDTTESLPSIDVCGPVKEALDEMIRRDYKRGATML